MRVVQVSRPNGPFEIVERPIPEPGAGAVRIKVLACGICHSDSLTKEGAYPGLQYPRVPGHEVAGVIDAVGPGVAGWKPGETVALSLEGPQNTPGVAPASVALASVTADAQGAFSASPAIPTIAWGSSVRTRGFSWSPTRTSSGRSGHPTVGVSWRRRHPTGD